MDYIIDTQNAMPIYEQLRNQVIYNIAISKLNKGDSLPSVRRLADDLEINFHTVNKAYALLSNEGYIVMDRRKGAVVADIQADGKLLPKDMSDRLDLIAAEAICRGMDYMNFVSHCMQSFRRAKGEQNAPSQ